MSSRVEEQINAFYSKCAMLDVPQECFPDPAFLKKIFRQHLSFFEVFTQKTDTKHAVDMIRKNILVAQMKNESRSIKPNIESVPNDFQRYIRYINLVEKIKNLKEKQQFLKQEEDDRLDALKANELKIIKAKETAIINSAKTDVLQAKLTCLNNKIIKEEALKKKIKDITPAKFDSSDSLDDFYSSIQQCIQILKEYSSHSNAEDDAQTRDKFWSKIETCMKRVPNHVLFQVILKRLSSKIEDSFLSSSTLDKAEPVKLSEKLLPYLYQHKIISGIELKAQKKRLEMNKKVCASTIQVFENEVEGQMNASIDCSFQLEDDDIIGEFLAVLIAKVNLEGKIKFCTDSIAAVKDKLEGNTKILEYEQLVNDTRSIYSFIDEKVAASQDHVAGIHQINEKINFSKISIMRIIQSLKIEKSRQFNRTLLNHTLNSTVIMNKENEVSIPNHEMEIQQFLEIPFHSLDKSLKIDRQFIHTNEDVVFNIINIAGHYAEPYYFLKLLEKRFKFGNQLRPFACEVTPSSGQVTFINYDDLQKKRFENSTQIAAWFDEITKMNVSIKSHLRAFATVIEFAISNPCRKYVPKTKRFEGKPYEWFEKEYMLYYKMLKR